MTELVIKIKNGKVASMGYIGDALPENSNSEIVRSINNILSRYKIKEDNE